MATSKDSLETELIKTFEKHYKQGFVDKGTHGVWDFNEAQAKAEVQNMLNAVSRHYTRQLEHEIARAGTIG